MLFEAVAPEPSDGGLHKGAISQWPTPGWGIVKLTGFRGTKPPYRVFRSGFTTHILGLSQLVMR